MMQIWKGGAALSEFRLVNLLNALSESFEEKLDVRVSAEFVYLIDLTDELNAEETAVAAKLLEAEPVAPSADGFFVTPRKGTISPWSTKASQIFEISGTRKVKRVERGIHYTITDAKGRVLTAQDLKSADNVLNLTFCFCFVRVERVTPCPHLSNSNIMLFHCVLKCP